MVAVVTQRDKGVPCRASSMTTTKRKVSGRSGVGGRSRQFLERLDDGAVVDLPVLEHHARLLFASSSLKNRTPLSATP